MPPWLMADASKKFSPTSVPLVRATKTALATERGPMGRRGSRRRNRSAGPTGVVVIDKPVGPTSFAVLRRVQRALGSGKAGHAGTLDPAASGVLVALLGEATKLSAWVTADDKRYEATVQLGGETDTLDAEGTLVRTKAVDRATWDHGRLEEACAAFVGTYPQIPPVFSAIKKDGRSLMSRARSGEVFEPDPRTVTCHELRLLSSDPATGCFVIDVTCAKGFYVRSLARDIARSIGEYGHLRALRRLSSGHFHIGQAKPPDLIGLHDVLPPQDAVSVDVVRRRLHPEQLAYVRNGRSIPKNDGDEHHPRALLTDASDRLVAMAVETEDGQSWKVDRGFNIASTDV